ncbi:hypothetical protein GT037_000095 [Alternaria burnsii]|uniref:Uncharacterized protein n=1 Tax=Alternaria burnsii TaxID=1187904 RepID=A0A8H7BCN8_9PLEO|nr:uncharacterized protein GT037_000095 [Alternaria burnsii]KAF7681119.1 hypothetical protein GT037_000095 [Alternaria burnsii]
MATASRDALAPAMATRKTASRRQTSKQRVLSAGKSKDPASFEKLENPEATIAGYCGCNDIGIFRRFYLSPLVLPYYIKSLSYQGYSRRTVLSYLGDLPSDRWGSDEDPQKVYPFDKDAQDKDSKDDRNPNYGMALVVCQMLRGLQKGLSSKTPKIDAAKFTELTDCTLPTGPALSKDEVPSFGPFSEIGESALEAHNRCLCLFAHLKYTTSKSQWDRRFHGKSAWDGSVLVSIEYLPDWMRAHQPVAIVDAPDEYTGPPAEVTQSVTVVWKHESKNRKNADHVKEMSDRDELTQVPKCVDVTLTKSMLGPEARDRIREAFKLHKFDAQLEQLTLHQAGNDFPALQANWETIFDTVVRYPDSTFTCLFRLRDDGESTWEYGGPPAVLRDFLEAEHRDVVLKNKPTPEKSEQVLQGFVKNATASIPGKCL